MGMLFGILIAMKLLVFAFCIGLVNGYTVPNQSYQGNQFYDGNQFYQESKYQQRLNEPSDPYLQQLETKYQQPIGQPYMVGYSNQLFDYFQNNPVLMNHFGQENQYQQRLNEPSDLFVQQLETKYQLPIVQPDRVGISNQFLGYVQNNPGFTNQLQNTQREQLTSYQQPQFERQNRYNLEQQNGWPEESSFQSRINDQGDSTNDQGEDFTFGEPERPKRRSMYKRMKKWGYYLYVVWPLLTGWGIIG